MTITHDTQNRYIILNGDEHCHYPLSYSVIDTKEGKNGAGYWKREMCETLYEKEAIEITKALNQCTKC